MIYGIVLRNHKIYHNINYSSFACGKIGYIK